jgi:predicted CoA-binding protein
MKRGFSTMSVTPKQINFFKDSNNFAIVGASADKSKFGNKVLMFYKGTISTNIFPVNPVIFNLIESR